MKLSLDASHYWDVTRKENKELQSNREVTADGNKSAIKWPQQSSLGYMRMCSFSHFTVL